MDNGSVLAIIFVLFCVLAYFLPAIVAFGIGKRNAAAILILNLFLGWTLIGWVAALVWCVMQEDKAA